LEAKKGETMLATNVFDDPPEMKGNERSMRNTQAKKAARL
jgi:hypothetical protein